MSDGLTADGFASAPRPARRAGPITPPVAAAPLDPGPLDPGPRRPPAAPIAPPRPTFVPDVVRPVAAAPGRLAGREADLGAMARSIAAALPPCGPAERAFRIRNEMVRRLRPEVPDPAAAEFAHLSRVAAATP